MAEVILLCGRICSGKTTYAQKLREARKAVVLSVDEITLALFPQQIGEMHDTYVERAEQYLFKKSVEIIRTGIPVILDWGFWQKAEREYARKFYEDRGITCEFHCIDISEGVWQTRIQKRNSAILTGETSAYFVDENLAAKFGAMFEMPDADEIDVWVTE